MSPEYIVFHVINTVSVQLMRDSAVVHGLLLEQLHTAKEEGLIWEYSPFILEGDSLFRHYSYCPKGNIIMLSLLPLQKYSVYLNILFVCLRLFFVKILFNG